MLAPKRCFVTTMTAPALKSPGVHPAKADICTIQVGVYAYRLVFLHPKSTEVQHDVARDLVDSSEAS